MEQLTPIVLLILWLIVSFLNSRKKQASAPARPAPRPETTSRPKESELEEMLKDVFGTPGKKDEEEEFEPVIVENQPSKRQFEPVLEMTEEPKPWQTITERELTTIEQDLRQTGQDYQSFETHETIFPETSLEEPTGLEAIEGDYKFSNVDGVLASMEETHAMLEQARLQSGKEMESVIDEFEQPDLREFNARDAVIFSAILNRKYA
ncbi:MAG TPA: hypothetical protein VLH61_07490 [Bacteroidales bacterium]|nr:hypothetical protein [Bacteroidales bacterium]